MPEIATSDHVLRVTALSIVLAVSLNPAAGLLCVMCCGPATAVATEVGCHGKNTDAASMTITAAHACDRVAADDAAIANDGARRLSVQRQHATPCEATLHTLDADREDARRVGPPDGRRYSATHPLSIVLRI